MVLQKCSSQAACEPAHPAQGPCAERCVCRRLLPQHLCLLARRLACAALYMRALQQMAGEWSAGILHNCDCSIKLSVSQ